MTGRSNPITDHILHFLRFGTLTEQCELIPSEAFFDSRLSFNYLGIYDVQRLSELEASP